MDDCGHLGDMPAKKTDKSEKFFHMRLGEGDDRLLEKMDDISIAMRTPEGMPSRADVVRQAIDLLWKKMKK